MKTKTASTRTNNNRAEKINRVVEAMIAYQTEKGLPNFGGLVLARAMQEQAFGPDRCEPVTFREEAIVKSLRWFNARLRTEETP
jgi:hypothetical protein